MPIHCLDTTIERGLGENGLRYSEVARLTDVTGGGWVRQKNLKARRRDWSQNSQYFARSYEKVYFEEKKFQNFP